MNAIATRWASAEETMRRLAMTVLGALAVAAALIFAAPAHAQNAQAQPSPYGLEEVVAAGHGFFGSTSGAIATAIERAFSMYGLPNGYILGQEAGGAFVGGLTYGEGTLYTKNAGDHSVFWQGPSLGWDFGGQGSRTMMLVYNLESIPSIYQRFVGVAGSAYAIAGLSHPAKVFCRIQKVVGIRLFKLGFGNFYLLHASKSYRSTVNGGFITGVASRNGFVTYQSHFVGTGFVLYAND